MDKYIKLNHSAAHLKLTQHCKSTILQNKTKIKLKVFFFQKESRCSVFIVQFFQVFYVFEIFLKNMLKEVYFSCNVGPEIGGPELIWQLHDD